MRALRKGWPQPDSGGADASRDARRAAKGAKAEARTLGRAQRGKRRGVSDLDLELAKLPLTDLGFAERFARRNTDLLIWCSSIGWHFWDARRWSRRGAEEFVLRRAHECARAIQDEAAALAASADDKVLSETKNAIRKLSDVVAEWGRDCEAHNKGVNVSKGAGPYLLVDVADLDKNIYKINFANGTLTIHPDAPAGKRMTFGPHDPADLITKISPVVYDPAAQCPTYDKFLAEVQPNAETRRLIHQWKGIALTGDVSTERLMMAYGKGANGKSTEEEICSYIAGDYAATIGIETFVSEGKSRSGGQPTPDLAKLPGVRMLRTSEPDKGAKLSEALIKLVTGRDPISARQLNMPFFEYYAQFKLTISGNYRPKIDGTDEGIWRRVILVPWNVTIAAERRDRNLGDKLKLEASGVLNRLLEGLCDFLDNGLTVVGEVRQATADYREDSDQLGRFIAACVVIEEGARVQSSMMHQLHSAWAKSNGATEWTNKGLTSALLERGFKNKNSNVMWWLDVRLTRGVNDFVDHEGRPLDQDRAAAASAAPIKTGEDTEFAG